MRPHVVLKSDLVEQAMAFCFGDGAIIPSLRDCFDSDGKVCPFQLKTRKNIVSKKVFNKDSTNGDSDVEEEERSEALSQRVSSALIPRVHRYKRAEASL